MRAAIIGGGAAGLMAAATLSSARPDAEVVLVERNDGLGKKVIISGGGRCNVTTGIHDIRAVLTNYPRGAKFLSSAMHAFPPEVVMAWFEGHGVPLHTEDDLRVFPQSNNGKDIVRVFERMFAAANVRAMLRTVVTGITRKPEGGFSIALNDQGSPLLADVVILTTGGQAYRHTGSTGDGYAFARSLGHSLTPLAPGLNAFFTQETWPADISGVSFERATITAHRTRTYAFTGPFLFTHKGISGPAVFALSSLVAFEPYDATQPLDVTIDLFPEQATNTLAASISARIAANPTRILANILAMVVPKSLAAICAREVTLPATRHASEIAKKEILRAVAWLKAIPLHVIQRGAGDEFVTAGGIPLTEVNPSTMESRICPGLYFAGEILNVDGFTGGFNLQASWATGRLAGTSAAQRDHLPSSTV